MKLSTRARYGLRLMIDLAANARGVPVAMRDVARRQRISRRYLEQLAVGLKNANLIRSSSGRGGGYWLQQPPEGIRVGDIMAAIMGPVNIVRCVRSPEACYRAESCPSRKMWVLLNDRINEVLRSVSLADLREPDIAHRPASAAALTPCSSFDGPDTDLTSC
jgi:Rrf2 family protein